MSVLSRVQRAAASALGYSTMVPGSRRLTRGFFSDTINIIYYHSVASREYSRFGFFPATSTSARLRSDLAWLSKHFRFTSLEAAIVEAGELDSTGRPPLAITFDDGFDLVADGVLEVIDEFGVTATAFINTETVANGGLMWRHALAVCIHERGEAEVARSYLPIASERGLDRDAKIMSASLKWPYADRQEVIDELWKKLGLEPIGSIVDKEKPYFTLSHLNQWVERGQSVGSHSATHPLCDTVPLNSYDREFNEPARWLTKELGITSPPFAYPFGRALPETAARTLVDEGVYSLMAGVKGFSNLNTVPWNLERYGGESGLSAGLFGRALLSREFRVS